MMPYCFVFLSRVNLNLCFLINIKLPWIVIKCKEIEVLELEDKAATANMLFLEDCLRQAEHSAESHVVIVAESATNKRVRVQLMWLDLVWVDWMWVDQCG